MNDIKQIDPITGLLSERSFMRIGDDLVHERDDLCVVRIDIEHFRIFVDWFGKEVSNKLLKQIGDYLNSVEKFVLCGYFGRDDFAVLMEYDKLAIEEMFNTIKDIIISISQSYGFLPAFGVHFIKQKSILLAIGRSLIACDTAKRRLQNRIVVFDEELALNFEKENQLLKDFKMALENNEISFVLQPQCRISSRKIVGAEALARWVKKDGTVIYPNDFVPILEKYGFIIDLDKCLWEKVLTSLKNWLDQGHKAVPVSVNVSRMDILSMDIAKHFEDLTKKYNIPHELIKIEITESAYIGSTNEIADLVNRLREKGFAVLMDDFGSGYSSLNMFSNIAVDAIKLDALFLNINEADFEKGIHVLESVVNMAKVISVPIIVEGVENQKQADFLEGLGCRYVQGFHFYRPMSAEKFEEIISDENNIDRRGFIAKSNEQFRIRELLDTNIYSDTMLNNILGPVAIYELHKNGQVDIVRYNEQFYETVGVPDFAERITDINRFVPEEDKETFAELFVKAKEDKLLGSEGTVRFYKTDGVLSTYIMHFYSIGKKMGKERFYGSAHNVTELQDIKDKMNLLSKYSNESVIFISWINEKWLYSVSSHSLGDIVGIDAQQLEKEMNDGSFVNRLVNKDDLKKLMESVKKETATDSDFIRYLDLFDKNGNPVKIELSFKCVKKLANNVSYVLFTKLV